MDGRVLIAVIFGAAVAAVVTYLMVKRHRLQASAICAFGIAVLVTIVTEGNRSRPEHNLVLAAQLALLGYGGLAMRAAMPARDRGQSTTGNHREPE